MVLLVDWLIDGLEAYGYSNFGACIGRRCESECAAKLSRAFFHNGNPKVSGARGEIGQMESAAVVMDHQAERIALEPEGNSNDRRPGMSNCIRHSLLANADQVMNCTRSNGNFLAFYFKLRLDTVTEAMSSNRPVESLRKHVRQFLGVTKIPYDPPRFGLAVCDHAT